MDLARVVIIENQIQGFFIRTLFKILIKNNKFIVKNL